MKVPARHQTPSRSQRRRARSIQRGRVAGRRGLGAFERRIGLVLAIFFAVMPIVAGLAPKQSAGGLGRFPCEQSPCGCRTPEQCWRFCCCNSPELRLAWSLRERVVPPDYAVLPAGWSSARVAAEIENRRTAAATGAPIAPASCCRSVPSAGPGALDTCCVEGPAKSMADGATCCSDSGSDSESRPLPVGGTPGRCSGEPASSSGGAVVLLTIPDSSWSDGLMIAPSDRQAIEVSAERGVERALAIETPPPRRWPAPIVM